MLPDRENATTEPLQPIKSGRSRKTPQPELLPQRSSRRTPKPEKTQPQQSTRKTLANRVTKKRGRPVKTAIPDQLDDASASHVTPAEEKGSSIRKKKINRVQKEKADAAILAVPGAQGEGIGTIEPAPSAAPSTGTKKRKKRKSIGQQSTSRAKTAKARSPLKTARQFGKKISKPDLAEATETDLGEALANEVQKRVPVGSVPLDRGEPTHLAEAAEVLDSGVDSVGRSGEGHQPQIAQKLKKTKRVAMEELPKKRAKASSSQSERAPRATKIQKEVMPTEDALDAVQNLERPAGIEAGSLSDVHEVQEAAAYVAKPRQGKPRKRKRVTVGQQPKKRIKASITPNDWELKPREETSMAEDGLEAAQRGGKPDEVELDSMAHVPEEQQATAEAEPQTQTQKPKRKKRKSIGQQKPKKKSLDLVTPNRATSKTAAARLVATKEESRNKLAAKRGRPRKNQVPKEDIENPQVENLGHLTEEEDIQVSETGLSSKPKASRGRPKAKPISEDTVDQPDEEASRPALEEDDEVQGAVLPEKKKRGRPRKADAAQATSQATRRTKTPSSRKPKSKPATTTSKARAPPKNTIPITVYAPPSPTSSDADDDPLATSHPTTTTTTSINPVDVLSQLCSELLSKYSSTLTEQAHSDDPSSSITQSDLERTLQMTDLYAQELASRLRQLTTTLNTNTSLQSRVKAAAKEERSLKKELKQLQKERGDLKGRKEEAMKERKKKELEDLLSGIAGAVKRGWEMQKDGEEGNAVANVVEEEDLEV